MHQIVSSQIAGSTRWFSLLISVSMTMLVTALSPASVQAQAYPNKSLRFIVPYPPGGTVDILGRVLGDALSRSMGQQVIIENVAGGGGQVGTTRVAKQVPPDGYTIVVNSSAPLATGVTLYPSMPYDVQKDLAAVSIIAENAIVLLVNADVPVKSLKELADYSKSRPEGIKLGIPSSGSMHHLTAEQFRMVSGAKATMVPYKGEAPTVADVVGGHLDAAVLNLPSALQQIKGGKLRALAVTSRQRSPLVPDVPTVIEAGMRALECIAWFAVMAPAATPKDVLAKLNAEFGKALQSESVKQRITAAGATAMHTSAEEASAFIRKEVAHWAKIAKESGAKFE